MDLLYTQTTEDRPRDHEGERGTVPFVGFTTRLHYNLTFAHVMYQEYIESLGGLATVIYPELVDPLADMMREPLWQEGQR